MGKISLINVTNILSKSLTIEKIKPYQEISENYKNLKKTWNEEKLRFSQNIDYSIVTIIKNLVEIKCQCINIEYLLWEMENCISSNSFKYKCDENGWEILIKDTTDAYFASMGKTKPKSFFAIK